VPLKKVIITGSSGMLGKDLVKTFLADEEFEIHGFDIKKSNFSPLNYCEHCFDLTDLSKLDNALKTINPHIIIHTAAIVNLKACEQDFNMASKLHIDVARTLAKEKAKIIYISTDSIFNGLKGDYSEEDIPDPLNNYAKTKYLGELAVKANNSNSIIIRTNIFGYNLPLRNSLVEWALKSFEKGVAINGFDDVIFNPIYTKQLSEVILKLLEKNWVGLINVGSANSISKLRFLQYLGEVSRYSNISINESSINDNNLTIIRPQNTCLDVTKAKKITKIPSIFRGIDQLISDYNKEK